MKQSCPNKNLYFQVALLTFLLILAFAYPAKAADFVDTKTNWDRVEISQLEAMNILQGYPDGRFFPEQPVSRAEFSKMLAVALGDKQAATELAGVTSIFSDITANFWAKGSIMAGIERGWLQGQGLFFGPDVYITRQEAAVILSRIQPAEEQASDKSELEFTDSDKIDSWAVAGVQKTAESGLITGFPDGTFRPLDQLSRAEAVHLLAMIMDQKGVLFDFNGLLKKAYDKGLIIQVAGSDRLFKLAERAQIFDRNNQITNWSDLFPARINFNVNNSGEINFARLSYVNEYLDLTTSQLATSKPQEEAVLSQSDNQQIPETGEVLAADEQTSDKAKPISKDQPELSLAAAQEAAGIKQLQSEMNVSGRGVTIAVIDSGIDPLQQDLQRTLDGQRKVVDWVNYSEEGRVETNLLINSPAGDKYINTSKGAYTLPGTVRSQSGLYHYGFWSEEWITYLHDIDFTGNNSNEDQIMVLAVDSKTPGTYDQVFVDTNQNFSLADEVPLKIYRDNKFNYASFPKTADLPQGFPFVLCDIGDGGNTVSFGYDSEGHGTHVAGIAAANGLLQGAAPNAQLIALKVADSAGIAYLDDTLKAVEYAVSKGADIINLSLGYYDLDDEEIKVFRNRINELAAHTLICVAAGNDGPGLSTLAAPADASNTLSVGAYLEPDMLSTDYGWTTESSGLWYFSSTGPAADGSLKPDLLAPGSAVSTVPAWTGESTKLIEGSSMAVPFVAGTAALLMEEMWKQGHGFNSLMIKQALASGTRKIDTLSATEQGHGVLDAYASARIVLQNKVLPDDSEVKVSSDLAGEGSGLMIRESIPGQVNFVLQNRDKEAKLDWQSKADWMQLGNNPLYLPAGSQRMLQVRYDLPAKPGLYTGLIEGTFVDSNRIPLEILNTIIVPEQWSQNGEINLYEDLTAGQMQRFYIQVPEGEESLQLKLKVLGSLNNLQGRVRMHIFDAAGQLYNVTEFAGLAPAGLTAQREVSEKIKSPLAGVWEVVIYSSSTLSDFGLAKSDYVFNAKLDSPAESPGFVEDEFIIGSACLRTAESQAEIQLTILNVSNNLPYSGLLQINGRLYYVDQGKVLVSTNIQRGAINLIVKKVN